MTDRTRMCSSRVRCLAFCLLALSTVPSSGRAAGLITSVSFHRSSAQAKSGVVYCPRAAGTIRIDGSLDEQAWQGCEEHTGFVLYPGAGTARQQTFVRGLWDGAIVYFGFRCEVKDPKSIKADADPEKEDNENAYGDDCLDVFLAPYPPDLAQFVLSASGARTDYRNRDVRWDGKWRSAVGRWDKGWTAEIAFSLQEMSFGEATAGRPIAFNVGRATAPDRCVSSLFPGYADVDRFGVVVLGSADDLKRRNESIQGTRYQLDPLNRALGTRLRLTQDRWAYDDLSRDAHVRVRLPCHEQTTARLPGLSMRFAFIDTKGEAVATQSIRGLKGEVVDVALDVTGLTPGRYQTQVEVLDVDGRAVGKAQHPLIRRQGPKRPPRNGKIPVRLARVGGAQAELESPTPVTFGVAMPRGAADGNTGFRLLDRQGRPVPAEAMRLASWEPRGTAKWVSIDCQAPQGAREGDAFSLEYGPGLAPAPPARPLVIERAAQALEVTTGPARFVISTTRFDLIHRAWLDANRDGQFSHDEEAVTGQGAQGPYVVDQDGKTYRAALDPDAVVAVEREGAVAVVICARGWYVAEDGAKLCRHVTRMHAYAGQAYLRVFHTFILTEDSTKVKLADVALATSVPSNVVAFGCEPRDLHCTSAGKGHNAYLLQYEHDAYEFRWDGHKRGRGRRAKGWLGTVNVNAALSVGLRDFWQNYPKELEAGERQLRVHLWPAHGRDRPRQPLTDDNISDLWFIHHQRLLDFEVPEWFHTFKGEREAKRYRYVRSSRHANGLGVARTHELLYVLHSGDESPDAAMAALQEPAVLAVSPSWMCRSGAGGRITAKGDHPFGLVEEALSNRFDGEQAMGRACEDYGMFNWGGAHSYFRNGVRDYDRTERPWRLTHHGGPRVPWLMYLRTGEPKYLDRGCRNTLRMLDLAFVHYTTPELERLTYPRGKIRGALNDYKGMVPWHSGSRLMDYNSMTDFMLYYYCLTGNSWGLEVANEWGQSVKRYFSSPFHDRRAAGTLDALLDLYKITWDPALREIAERLAVHVMSLQQPDGNFRSGHWYTYAPWLSDYYELTGSETAAKTLVRWADAYVGNRVWTGYDNTYESGYAHYDVLAAAHRITGNVKYLAHGLGRMLVIAESVNSNRGSAVFGADQYGVSSLGGYYAQTVPYILGPLAELKQLPAPVFPPWRYHPGDRAVIYVLDETDEAITLSLPLSHSAPAEITVVDPSGREAVHTTVEPPKPRAFYLTLQDPPRVEIPRDGHTGCYQVRMASESQFGIWLPLGLSRPVKVVHPLKPGASYARGSAVYLMIPKGVSGLTLSVSGRNSMGHTVALYDPAGHRAAWKHWFGLEEPSPHRISADCPPALQGQPWCLLQGLSKSLTLTAESKGVPAFFATRPERFFVPTQEVR